MELTCYGGPDEAEGLGYSSCGLYGGLCSLAYVASLCMCGSFGAVWFFSFALFENANFSRSFEFRVCVRVIVSCWARCVLLESCLLSILSMLFR
jgi:hypothetical protein